MVVKRMNVMVKHLAGIFEMMGYIAAKEIEEADVFY